MPTLKEANDNQAFLTFIYNYSLNHLNDNFMKNVTFTADQLVNVSELETLELSELREIANLAKITGYATANKKLLISKITIHYNQAELLNARLAVVKEEQAKQEALNTPPTGMSPEVWATFTPEQKQAINGFSVTVKSTGRSVTQSGPITTVPYTELPIGTVLSKNGKVLLVAGHPKQGHTVLASEKLCWTNTNPIVTGVGSTILVEGNGTLPTSFDNPEYQACLNKAVALLNDNKAKQVKQSIKDLLELNNAGKLPVHYMNFINRIAEKLTAEPVTVEEPENSNDQTGELNPVTSEQGAE